MGLISRVSSRTYRSQNFKMASTDSHNHYNTDEIVIITDTLENSRVNKKKNSSSRSIDNQNHLTFTKHIEPIIIQTDPKKYKLHGLVDHFDETLPHELVGKVSPDEFKITISKINNLLKRRLKSQQKRLIASTIFCGLTLGTSFYFAYDYNEKTMEKLKQLIAQENKRIYVDTLNMRWTLIMRPMNKFLEYNLIIEFLPKFNFTLPD